MTKPDSFRGPAHTEQLMVNMHPDLMRHVEKRATEGYCSRSEFIRRLIIEDINSEEKK